MKYNKAFIAAAVLALSAGYAVAQPPAFSSCADAGREEVSGATKNSGCGGCISTPLHCPTADINADQEYTCVKIDSPNTQCASSSPFFQCITGYTLDNSYTTGPKCVSEADYNKETGKCARTDLIGKAEMKEGKCKCAVSGTEVADSDTCPCAKDEKTVIYTDKTKHCIKEVDYIALETKCKAVKDATLIDGKCICDVDKSEFVTGNACPPSACTKANRQRGTAGSDIDDVSKCGVCVEKSCKMTSDAAKMDFSCTDPLNDDLHLQCADVEPWIKCAGEYEAKEASDISKGCKATEALNKVNDDCREEAKKKLGYTVFQKDGKSMCGCAHGLQKDSTEICACKDGQTRNKDGTCPPLKEKVEGNEGGKGVENVDKDKNSNEDKCKAMNRVFKDEKCGNCKPEHDYVGTKLEDATHCHPHVKEEDCKKESTRTFLGSTKNLCVCKDGFHPAEEADVSSTKACSGATQIFVSSSVFLLSVAASALFFF